MKLKWIITAMLLVATSTTVRATEGINLIGIGPVQQGTAGAGVASAKDSTWLILNPAGLTDLSRRADTSLQYFAPVRTINSTANPSSGTQEDSSAFVIPSISASLGCCRKDSGHLGIGLYGTSGMGVDYKDPRFGFSAGDTRTELSIAKLTLTYAEKFDNGLSVGAGPIFVLSRFRSNMETSRTGPPSVKADGSWDGAVGVGFIVGVNKRLNDKLTIGGSYMSEQYMTEFDEYKNLLSGSLNLPQQLTVGLAYNVRANVEVALDYRWLGWSHLDTLGDQFGWEDQNIVKAGVTWGATDRLTLRGGISHGNSPVGNDVGVGNSLFPAIMETHLAFGASYQFDKFRLDLAYVHALDASVTGNGNDTGGAGAGTDMSMYQNNLTIGAGWTF